MKKHLLKITFAFLIVFILALFTNNQNETKASDKNTQIQTDIESALFTETDFFGEKTFVPFPTETAKDNLLKVREKYPNEPQIYVRLANLFEKLEDFENAEQNLQKNIELSDNKINALETLGTFYQRRAKFKAKAETIEKILHLAEVDQRSLYFSILIEFAKTHELKKYLEPEFIEKFIDENPFTFNVIERYLDELINENKLDKALDFIRNSKERFPEKYDYFLEKEVSILPAKLAEEVYVNSFDYFWSSETSDNFYRFLSEHDRLRAYGVELKNKHRENKADFDTAIRLIHYRKNDYQYGNDSAQDIILQIERVRKENDQNWTSEELLTISRILILEGNGDLASRFLYTLFLQDDVQQKGELRANVLYQLFEVFINASSEKLPLTKGDLKFYEEIAKADSNPGISTGILSLIFSDANIRSKFEQKENDAVELFNRSAAYNLFLEYKKEQPTSKQLAQMYLNIVRIYTAENDLQIAEKTLSEFEQRFEHTDDYANVTIKLADAYIAIKDFEKERQTYQKILDYLGRNQNNSQSLIPTSKDLIEPTDAEPFTTNYSYLRNLEQKGSYTNDSKYTDHFSKEAEKINYQIILTRLISSLSKDNKTKEILAVYTNEIKKYPNEQGLYEQLLQWLGRTNLTEKQLETYNKALKKFPTKSWNDRLSRWFIRREKMQEFDKHSRNILANFDGLETESFLSEFIDGKSFSDSNSFNSKLYEGLYTFAHKRFPHNRNITQGLLKFYKSNQQDKKLRKMLAKYYFDTEEIREEFLLDLAKRGELRTYFFKAKEKIDKSDKFKTIPYQLFYADAARKLSSFEQAVDTYKVLDKLYPNTSDFTEPLLNLTRSFGQKDRKTLETSADISKSQADHDLSNANLRTRSGEIQAELGNYDLAKEEWKKLVSIESGSSDSYLNTATVFWDYFQFKDAIDIFKELRQRSNDKSIYAFQMGAIHEAQNKVDLALNEYIKALGSEETFYKTKKRLTKLYRRKGYPARIQNAFYQQKPDSNTILGFGKFLIDVEKEKGLRLIRQETLKENSFDFLAEAMAIFRENKDAKGKQIALRQLSKTNKSPRKTISYEFQLANSFFEIGQKKQATDILASLVKKHPTNYGVLKETSDLYWRIGEHDKAISLLQIGMNRGIGKFRYRFGRKLAKRLRYKNRFDQAENVLLKIFSDNRSDAEVFRELTTLYVQTKTPRKLRKITDEAFEDLNNQNFEPRELKYELTERRKNLINAFTRLKDYGSAVEQHIEIINLEPELTENLDEAIRYVNRYGGAETLLTYYKKTAEQSYKNYRWFMILGKLYEANKDYRNAIKNYKVAIHNQPEILELYESLLQSYLSLDDHRNALETVNKLLELTNGQIVYVKVKIIILRELGRFDEAKTETAKLPLKEQKNLSEKEDNFAKAGQLKNQESIKKFQKAFAELNENPFKSELKANDITSYIKTVRKVDNLDAIFKDFWALRKKIIAELENKNSTNAGKARDLLKTIDGTLPNAIGSVAETVATHRELSALYAEFENKINKTKGKTDQYKTLSLLYNLIQNCDFDELTEKVLIAQKDEAFAVRNSDIYHRKLSNLIDFHEKHNDFYTILTTLQTERSRDKNKYDFAYEKQIAKNAKLLGKTGTEIKALEDYFNRITEKNDESNELLERYFELLYQNDKQKLHELAENNSKHRIQFINFLIGKSERDLAYKAIRASNFSEIWKTSRRAETSLILNDFASENEEAFSLALNIAPIGEMIEQTPKLETKEWFNLSQTFGKWLYLSDQKDFSAAFITAGIENAPKDFAEQMRLGNFYLSQKIFPKALEHFQIAYELNPNNTDLFAKLGISYFQVGEIEKSNEFWAKIIEGKPNRKDALLYLETLTEYGQASFARENLKEFLIKTLNKNDRTFSEESDVDLTEFIKEFAKGFRNENEKTQYFLKILQSFSKSNFLLKFLIAESIIADENLIAFYKVLIRRSNGLNSYEYDAEFKEFAEYTYNLDELENLYEQESESEIAIPESEKIEIQKEFLEYLIKHEKFLKAENLTREIEISLKKRFVRPEWLRLAKIELSLLQNKTEFALENARNFVGIKASSEAKSVKLPNIERFNDVIKLLEKSNRNAESSKFKKEFYARRIALVTLETSSFIELARIAFEQKDFEFGNKMLRLLNEIAINKDNEKWQKELAELPLIKTFSSNAEKFENSRQKNSLDAAKALKQTAELLIDFGFLSEAKSHYKRLLKLVPFDANARIDYARLCTKIGEIDEAVKNFVYVIENRNALQTSRWKAFLVAREIALIDAEFSDKLNKQLNNLDKTDAEMWSLLTSKDFAENSDLISIFAKYLRAKNALENEKYNLALKDFALLSTKERNSKMTQSFGVLYETPLAQMIRIYSKTKSPLAALKVGEDLEFSDDLHQLSKSSENFIALNKQMRNLQAKSDLEILTILSGSAERSNEFTEAIKFEEMKVSRLKDSEKIKTIEIKISKLKGKLKNQNKMPKVTYKLDKENVSKESFLE